MLVAMPCASKALLSIYVSLSCVLALLVGCRSRSCGLGLLLSPSPIFKGLDHFLCMSMFAYLLLYFISMLASLDLGFTMLCAFRELVLVWSHPSLLGINWM